jgi:hypothetical protein
MDRTDYDARLYDRSRAVPEEHHNWLKHELRRNEERYAAGEISEQELARTLHRLSDEIASYSVIFASEADFEKYFREHPNIHDEFYEHEKEHAAIYKKHGIPVLWGVHLLLDHDGTPGFGPFIGAQFPPDMPKRQQLEIELEATENVAHPSDHDLEDVAALKRILGKSM